MEELVISTDQPKTQERLTKEQWEAQQAHIKLIGQLVRKTKHKALRESGNFSFTNRV